ETLVRRTMRERGVSFKVAVNQAIVAGLTTGQARQAVSTPTFDLGRARVPVEQALRLAGELEDEELLRKRAMGK
ncbi:MAG: antitoxin, partial [Ornithinimicrobium sp.]